MGPEYFWGGGMWIMPFVFFPIMLLIMYLVFGRGGFRPPWQGRQEPGSKDRQGSESPLDILKTRYAKGEITKEEFEQMKKDI